MHGNLACLLILLALAGGCRSPVELEQALGYPCAPDAGASGEEAQCPVGSRCGLESRCHVIGEAAAYRCEGDEHCEGGWRCGSDQRCLDASGEALAPVLPGGTPVVTPLVPPLFRSTPSLLATTEYEGTNGCFALSVEAFAAVGTDGVLEIVHRVPEGSRDIPLHTPNERCQEAAGPSGFPLLPSRTERHDLGSKTLLALAASQDRVSGITADGHLCEVALDVRSDQAWTCELPLVPAGARALRTPARHQGWNSERTLVAFDATSFGVQTGLNQPFHGPFQVHRGDGQPLVIHDLIVFEDEVTGRLQLFVGTDHGLHTAWFDGDPFSPGLGRLMRAEVPATWLLEDGNWTEPDWPREAGTPWRRVPLNGSECEWAQFPFVQVVSWLGWMGEATSWGMGALLFRVEESDVWPGGGIHALPLEIVPERTMPPTQNCEPVPLLLPGWSGSIRLRAVDGHPPELLSFPEGARPGALQLAPLTEGGVRVDGWLGQADGGVMAISGLSRRGPELPFMSPMTSGSAGNLVQSAFLNRPHVRSQHSPTRALAANDLGQAWAWGSNQFSPYVSRVPLTPVLFAPLVEGDEVEFEARSREIRVGDYVLEPGGGLAGTADGGVSFSSGLDVDGVLAILPGLKGASLGTLVLPSGLEVHVWIQFFDEGDQFTRVLGVLPAFSAPQPPHGAILAPTADGGTALLTSAADTLFAVDVTAELADPTRGRVNNDDFDLSDFPRAEVVLVPLPRSNITSIAPISARDGEYASGFLLAGHRVFRYHASNAIVWRSAEIAILDGVPHEVWSTDDRARIGYTDGRVLSLPGRLQLAAPLPLEAGPALDYVQVCGQTYVLARFGLHRLVGPTADAKLAHWEPVALGPEVHKAAHPKRGYLGSTLFGGQQGLLFFDPAGRGFRIDQLGCQP